MNLLNIIWTFMQIGLFSFGGGYAMLPLIQQQVTEVNKWVSVKEFIDMVAISQITPGPIAINIATYVGFKVNFILGAAAATLGVILPSIIIMLFISKFFIKFKGNNIMEYAFWGLRPATVGLVAAAAILVSFESFIDYKSLIIFGAAFYAAYKYKVDPILMIIIAGVAGVLIY